MNLRPLTNINATAFVDAVFGAAAAQDRRVEREGSVIIGRAFTHPGFASMTPEKRAEASRKGGLVRKLTASEIAARDAEKALREAQARRSAERRQKILALRDEGLSVRTIARKMGVSTGIVSGTICRHGRRGERGRAVYAANPSNGRQLRGFAAMTPEKRREVQALGRKSAMQRYGLTLEEFQTYGVIRAKGFSAKEAADIILGSRRTQQGGAA